VIEIPLYDTEAVQGRHGAFSVRVYSFKKDSVINNGITKLHDLGSVTKHMLLIGMHLVPDLLVSVCRYSCPPETLGLNSRYLTSKIRVEILQKFIRSHLNMLLRVLYTVRTFQIPAYMLR